MGTPIREEYGVDAITILKGFFYEAYLESAIYLSRVMVYNTAKTHSAFSTEVHKRLSFDFSDSLSRLIVNKLS